MQQGEQTRRTALSILARILNRGQTLEQAWAAIMDGTTPRFTEEPSDRAFVRQLVATVLRHIGELDALIAPFLRKPLPKDRPTAAHILRLGAAQLVYLKIPPHAAVNTTVALAIGPTKPFRGLINAVLHRIAATPQGKWSALERAKMNLPEWMWSRLVRDYGEATAAAIAHAHEQEPPLDLCFSILPLAARYQAIRLPTGAYRRAIGGRVEDLPGYGNGTWWVQDAAAQLPVRLLGDVTGKKVADLCAAPGGKTRQLLAAGATVTAVERSAARAKQLLELCDAYPDQLTVITEDVSAYSPAERFDAVLLDAPCTATGTIRRHPDVPWVKSESDVQRLAAQQRQLLARAVTLVAPGGRLVFCTCSLLSEEGEDVAVDMLQHHNHVTIDPILPADLPSLEDCINPQGYARTLPCHWQNHGGIDGFFMARFRIANDA